MALTAALSDATKATLIPHRHTVTHTVLQRDTQKHTHALMSWGERPPCWSQAVLGGEMERLHNSSRLRKDAPQRGWRKQDRMRAEGSNKASDVFDMIPPYIYTEKQTNRRSLRGMKLLSFPCNSGYLLTFPSPSAAPIGRYILMTVIQPVRSIWSSDVAARDSDDSGEVWQDDVKTSKTQTHTCKHTTYFHICTHREAHDSYTHGL